MPWNLGSPSFSSCLCCPVSRKRSLVLDPRHLVTVGSHTYLALVFPATQWDSGDHCSGFFSCLLGGSLPVQGSPNLCPALLLHSHRALKDLGEDRGHLDSRYVGQGHTGWPLDPHPHPVMGASNDPQMCFQGAAGELGHSGPPGFLVSRICFCGAQRGTGASWGRITQIPTCSGNLTPPTQNPLGVASTPGSQPQHPSQGCRGSGRMLRLFKHCQRSRRRAEWRRPARD